jgi:hypothetical protein
LKNCEDAVGGHVGVFAEDAFAGGAFVDGLVTVGYHRDDAGDTWGARYDVVKDLVEGGLEVAHHGRGSWRLIRLLLRCLRALRGAAGSSAWLFGA